MSEKTNTMTDEHKILRRNLHVSPRGKRWPVRWTGSMRASAVYDTQAEAIARARGLARKHRCILFIHGRDGRIRKRISYENCIGRD